MPDTLEWRTICGLLADESRRRLLVALLDQDEYQYRQTVARGVHLLDDSLGATEVDLAHVHLPKLEAAGVITWSRDAHSVSRGPTFDDIESLLRLLHENRHVLPKGWV
jgi:hypothetical protein